MWILRKNSFSKIKEDGALRGSGSNFLSQVTNTVKDTLFHNWLREEKSFYLKLEEGHFNFKILINLIAHT